MSVVTRCRVWGWLAFGLAMGCSAAQPAPDSKPKPTPLIVRDAGLFEDANIEFGYRDGNGAEIGAVEIRWCRSQRDRDRAKREGPRMRLTADLVVRGFGSRVVAASFPVLHDLAITLGRHLGPRAIAVRTHMDCGAGSGLRVLVDTYASLGALIQKTAAYLASQNLTVDVAFALATDREVARGQSRPSIDAERGTMALVKSRPGTIDGVSIRHCQQDGLFGMTLAGRTPSRRAPTDFNQLRATIETEVHPHVGYGQGCDVGQVAFRVYVSHLRDVDGVVTRATAFLSRNRRPIQITVQLLGRPVTGLGR